MSFALVNGRVLTPSGFEEGKAVVLADGEIQDIVDAATIPEDMPRRDLEGHRLLPGFIDTQVNGGGGALFNDAPTVDTIVAIGETHRRFGTTGFLPTLISDDLSVVNQAIQAVDAAILAGAPGVLGIHIEGPFLNARRRGIHDASKFRTLDDDAFTLLTSLKHGKTLVTLAPELTSAAMIRRLAQAGVIVAAGHTNADYATVRLALDSGMSGFTHLFNAMSPMTSREPGAVGAALEDQSAWCGLIVDGRHVSPVVMRIALRSRPLDRFMLVTDGMPSVGLENKTFELQGRTIRVVDGVCVDEDGVLAGADLDMMSTVRNAVEMLDLSFPEAVAMASKSPADFLGLSNRRGIIAPKFKADLVLMSDAYVVLESWIDGKPTTA